MRPIDSFYAEGETPGLILETRRMVDLFKFRCLQCQTPLGAPPSKFGKVIRCPRCKVELVVPVPGDEPTPNVETEEAAFSLENLGLRLDTDLKPTRREDPALPNPIAFLEQGTEPEPDPEEEPIPVEGLPQTPDPMNERLVPGGPRRGRSELLETTSRRRDVVLPRTAAVAWALSGLIAQGIAFIAGMMIGHYLWK